MIHSILLVQFTCLTVLFHNLSPGPLWSTSWSGTLFSTYISSPNHYLLLATHAHTTAVCFAIVPRLCHLLLISLCLLARLLKKLWLLSIFHYSCGMGGFGERFFYVEPNMRGKCEITGFGITCMCILPICYMRSEVWVISYQQGCIAVCLCKSRLLLHLVPLIHS